MNDGARIALDERVSDLFAADLRRGIACAGKNRDTFFHVVRIGGEDVHGLALEQPLRRAARALAPESGEGRTGYLNHAALLGELDHALEIFAQNGIALGMRDDRGQAAIAQFEQRVGGRLRNAVVAELDQQIARVPDCVTRGMRQSILQIVVGKMEVAAEQKLRCIPNPFLQFVHQFLRMLTIVRVSIVGMRRRNHVGDAVGGSGLADLDAYVPCLGAIIDIGENV